MAFYYKWTDEYIESMPIDIFDCYLKSSYVLEYQQKQMLAHVAIIPKLKKSKVDKFFKEINVNIKSFFKKEISGVNAKYLAEQMLEGNDGR